MRARLLVALTGGALVLLLGLPLVALLTATPLPHLLHALTEPLVLQAFVLSVTTSAQTLLLTILLATPLAWWLAQHNRRSLHLVETALHLPVVVPPAVAGLALLLAFGRQGLLSTPWGFTPLAVVLAQFFVAAPLYLHGAIQAFRRIDPNVLLTARTLGATPTQELLQLGVPLALRGLLAAGALALARSLGEFGATLLFAGSLPGRTQTLPLAIYAALDVDVAQAEAMALLLLALAGALLLAIRRGEQ